MESSRRDLFIDVSEPKSLLKTDENTFYPRFSFMPKTGKAFPKTGVCFYCEKSRLLNITFPVITR